MTYQIVTNLIEIGTLISGGVMASYSLASGIQGAMDSNKQKKVFEERHDVEVKNFQEERQLISMVMLGLQSLDPQIMKNFMSQNSEKIKNYISTLSYKNIDPFRKEAHRRLQPEIRRISIIILKDKASDPSKVSGRSPEAGTPKVFPGPTEQDIQNFMSKINTSNIFEYIDSSEKILLREKINLVMYIKGFQPDKDNREGTLDAFQNFYLLYEKQIQEEVKKINSQNIENYRKEAEQKLGKSLNGSATSISGPTPVPGSAPTTAPAAATSKPETPGDPSTPVGISKEEKEKKYEKQVQWQKQKQYIFNKQLMDFSPNQQRLPKEEIQEITKHREKTNQNTGLQQLANKQKQQQQQQQQK